MNALIRANLHVDPETLSDEDFAEMAGEAVWLEEWRREHLTATINHAIVASFETKDKK